MHTRHASCASCGLPPAATLTRPLLRCRRMHRAVDRLSFEEKRSLIYGGDMIVP